MCKVIDDSPAWPFGKREPNDGSHLVVEWDFLKTLENCQGHYVCPVGPDGKLLGPVVGYTAPYTASDGSEKKWVGLEYFNFSMADQWSAVLKAFAFEMASKLVGRGPPEPDLIVGAPWAGVKFSQAVALRVGCRHIFAEKEVVGFDDKGKKIEKLILGRYEGMIHVGDRVVIGEELVNNASTTKKLIDLIENAGGQVVAIACAINRSYPFRDSFEIEPGENIINPGRSIPIISVIERSTPQYRQDDPLVAEAIAADNVVWKPKYAWDRMKAAMHAARQG
jgi:adenine/guanine phosphoribosyltransferase-like PRPP-binding protein